MAKKLVADLMADYLERRDVKYVFGLCGRRRTARSTARTSWSPRASWSRMRTAATSRRATPSPTRPSKKHKKKSAETGDFFLYKLA